MQVTDLIVPLTRLVVSLKALQAMMQELRVAVQKKGKAVKNPNRNGPLRRNANLNKYQISAVGVRRAAEKISKEIVDNSLDVINRIVTEAKEIPFMEDGAEVLAKAQYQLTLTYEEFCC
jgi:hypothetical protein